MAIEDLYQEIILDHYKNPRNKGTLENPDFHQHAQNPLCGDEIDIYARVQDGILAEVTFAGQGCSISQSSASMLTEALKGKTVAEAEELIENFRKMLAGQDKAPDEDLWGELAALRGVTKFPARVKCAVLAWDTAQKGIQRFRGKIHS